MEIWQVVVLGLIEGLTEFIPVSSTGHLLLAGNALGIDQESQSYKAFVVLIQLGAVLAILTVYFGKLWSMLISLPSDPNARRFVLGVLLAFLPAAALGALGHSFIKEVLFNPLVVCVALIVGGVVLLAVDRMALKTHYTEVEDYPLSLAVKIGLCQCLALIPGVSRSGATIVGGLLMGADKRSSAEFSFYLAMPTMAGAFAYDLYKNWSILHASDLGAVALGFVTAFVVAVIVVRYVLDFITSHGFAPFAYWRIIVGGLGLGTIFVFG